MNKPPPSPQFYPTSEPVTIEIADFPAVFVKQETDWCWADCAAWIAEWNRRHSRQRGNGQQITQQMIVQQTYGLSATAPAVHRVAILADVLGALDPGLYQRVKHDEQTRQAQAATMPTTTIEHPKTMATLRALYQGFHEPKPPSLALDADKLRAALIRRQPAVLAFASSARESGHIVVIFGGTFQEGTQGDGTPITRIVSLRILDPNPGPDHEQDGIYEYTGDDLSKVAAFVATRADADLYLKYLNEKDKFDHDVDAGRFDEEIKKGNIFSP